MLTSIINKNLQRAGMVQLQALQHPVINQKHLDETINYLNSESALLSINNDPYWPKWAVPWWRIVLLDEMDLLHLVPETIIEKLTDKINSFYIKFFPLSEAEIPEGIDPVKQIICHCQLATIYKILTKKGLEDKLDWAREWFIKYQLNDGGLNCDESVYTNEKPNSSIVSTLSCLEAVLAIKERTEAEDKFLDKGAEYLINKKIFRKSDGSIINKHWLMPFFPRFYEYDILRGLSFLVSWSLNRNKKLPCQAITQTLEILEIWLDENNLLKPGELYFLSSNQTELFPLLEDFTKSVNGKKAGYIFLSREWYQTISKLKLLLDKNLLI